MNIDQVLGGISLVELVSRLDGAAPLVEYCSMESVECGHQLQTLFLADALVRVSEQTGFDLSSFLNAERERALACSADEPPAPGMA